MLITLESESVPKLLQKQKRFILSLFQVSCHSMTESKMESRLVVHVKRGCSSGYMCLSLTGLDNTLVSASYGLRSHHPEEACTHHYFSSTTTTLLVADTTSSPCPFSGSYTVQGRLLQGLQVEEEEKEGCQTVMQVLSKKSLFYPGLGFVQTLILSKMVKY